MFCGDVKKKKKFIKLFSGINPCHIIYNIQFIYIKNSWYIESLLHRAHTAHTHSFCFPLYKLALFAKAPYIICSSVGIDFCSSFFYFYLSFFASFFFLRVRFHSILYMLLLTSRRFINRSDLKKLYSFVFSDCCLPACLLGVVHLKLHFRKNHVQQNLKEFDLVI